MSLADELATQLPPGGRLDFGQLRLERRADGAFEARHRDDGTAPPDPLDEIDSAHDLRELAKFDAGGTYRPLKTAPTLKPGWRTETSCPREFLKRLDAIYPGAFAAWIAHRRGELPPVALRRTLDRQTGIYRFAGTISDGMARRILEDVCAKGCLRQVIWPLADGSPALPLKVLPGTVPLVCAEACTFVLNRARELAREAFEVAESKNGDGPPAL